MNGSKKNLFCLSTEEKKGLIDTASTMLSIRRQCDLIGLPRSNLYYEPVKVSKETLNVMNRIDEIFTEFPFYGSRRIRAVLLQEGWVIGRERIQRLMRQMGITAIYPKPKLSKRDFEHTIYPYLLSQ